MGGGTGTGPWTRVDEILSTRTYSLKAPRELGVVLAARTRRLEALAIEKGELVLGVCKDLTVGDLAEKGMRKASESMIYCKKEEFQCPYHDEKVELKEDLRREEVIVKKCPECKRTYWFYPSGSGN
jgi:hypothetical protein